jgi:hypothetical protein
MIVVLATRNFNFVGMSAPTSLIFNRNYEHGDRPSSAFRSRVMRIQKCAAALRQLLVAWFQGFWLSAPFPARWHSQVARAIRRSAASIQMKSRQLPSALLDASLALLSDIDLLDHNFRDFASPTQRYLRSSRHPIASTKDQILRLWIRMNGPV